MPKSNKREFSYTISPKRVDAVCNLDRSIKSEKDCDVGETLVSGYKRSCPYKALVAAYCRQDPRLEHMINRMAKTIKDEDGKNLKKMWEGVTTYIEMLYLMYLFYKGKVEGWIGNKFSTSFEGDGEAAAKLCRYGILPIGFIPGRCDNDGTIVYSSIVFICPRTCSEFLSKKLKGDEQLVVSIDRFMGTLEPVEFVERKACQVVQGKILEEDCIVKDVTNLTEVATKAREAIELYTNFPPKLMNIVDGFDLYFVGLKKACGETNAADIVLSIMKDRNFFKVF